MIAAHVLVHAWLALLVLQASWSYRRMQTIGWLMVIWPFVAARTREHQADHLSRLVVHFNTHPLLAPLVMGAALEAYNRNEPDFTLAKDRLVRWMGTFGALGDVLYWQVWHWNSVGLAVCAYALAGTGGLSFWAAVLVVAEITARVALFELGRREPDRVPSAIMRLADPKLRSRLKQSGLALIALAAGFSFAQVYRHTQAPWVLEAVGLATALVAVAIATRTRFRSVVLWLPPAVCLILDLLQ